MAEYFAIAVNVPKVSGNFHYHAPEELKGRLKPGHLVQVPFGPRRVQGVVLETVADPEVPETKPIELLLDEIPVLTDLQLQLARILAATTLAPVAACVSLMLPPGIGKVSDVQYALTQGRKNESVELPPAQKRIVELLSDRGPLRSRQVSRALPRKNWRSSIGALVHKGYVEATPLAPVPSVRPKTTRTVERTSAIDGDVKLGRGAAQARRGKILELLGNEAGPVDASRLLEESGGKSADLTALTKLGLVRLSERELFRDPLDELTYDLSHPPELTADQERVWEHVHKALAPKQRGQATKPILLHGVTGSGKTEIYLQAVAKTLTMGRQAIVLVPEIALTPQTARRFLERFPNQVGLIHSELSEGERYDTWRRARAGRLPVIIGPRSALFAPLGDIGLIVIDEEHDDSYYEAGQLPHYHARAVALEYARLTGAVCLMGSATPDIGSYFDAEQGRWDLLQLPARILAHRDTARAHNERIGRVSRYQKAGEDASALDLPHVEIVDMRGEMRAGNRSIFSRAMQNELKQVIEDGQQAILFLNRRGTATYIFCRDCGHVLRCPNCDNPLTQHLVAGNSRPGSALICHHCGYTRQVPRTCPNCGSAQIRHYGTGTETVEAEVLSLFPNARTLRWDRSSTRTKRAHERILLDFSRQKADVLVGTQMLAKGLDLPLVTLVGVVLADVGLQLPDYRASERVFQVLTQVAGRAGRSPLGGKVILQTFQPDHYAIRAAARHDYGAFYTEESRRRKELRYPPFAQLLRLEHRHLDSRKAQQNAEQMAETLSKVLSREQRRGTEMVGPAPCYYSRINRQYRWQILLKGADPASLLDGVKVSGWRLEVNPPSLL